MKNSQSLNGYIREHIVEFEARLSVGIRQEVMIEELKTKGYITTLQGLRNALFLARKRDMAKPKKPKGKLLEIEPTVEKEAPQSTRSKTSGFQYGDTKKINESDLY